jgi:hypothetical protein
MVLKPDRQALQAFISTMFKHAGRGTVAALYALADNHGFGKTLAVKNVRAAHVLSQRVGSLATTLHRLIYCGGQREPRIAELEARKAQLEEWRKFCTPREGERITCAIYTGSMWRVVAVEIVVEYGIDCAFLHLAPLDADGQDITAMVPVAWFAECESGTWLNDDFRLRELGLDCFRFGYAVTCHSAQGSQWDRVVVVDEGGVFGENAWRWRYTAATRAVHQLTFARNIVRQPPRIVPPTLLNRVRP